MFTCVIRYELDPEKLADFRAYAESWIELIERYGGTHLGYFLPADPETELPAARFSFPGLGRNGPENIGYALFSFPDVATYDSYRQRVAEDPDCRRATERFEASKCFRGYQRHFLERVI